MRPLFRRNILKFARKSQPNLENGYINMGVNWNWLLIGLDKLLKVSTGSQQLFMQGKDLFLQDHNKIRFGVSQK